jgi:hypothetical protein
VVLGWPEFPEEYRSKLSAKGLDGCFCPNCANDLWDCLPEHLEVKGMDDLRSPSTDSENRDVRQVLACFRHNLEPLKQFAYKLEPGSFLDCATDELSCEQSGALLLLFEKMSYFMKCMDEERSKGVVEPAHRLPALR